MPSKWEWWAGYVGETYDLWCADSREEVITNALREADPGMDIQIVEAQSSTAAEYEGAEFVPFVRTRNHEIIGRKGPQSADQIERGAFKGAG